MKHQVNPLYIQRGGSYRGIQYHRNPGYTQRGHGLGSIFRSLWRFSLPLAKAGAKAGAELVKENRGTIANLVKDQALESGMKLAANTLKKSEAKANKQNGAGLRIVSASIRHKNDENSAEGVPTKKKKRTKHKDIFSS